MRGVVECFEKYENEIVTNYITDYIEKLLRIWVNPWEIASSSGDRRQISSNFRVCREFFADYFAKKIFHFSTSYRCDMVKILFHHFSDFGKNLDRCFMKIAKYAHDFSFKF